MKDLTNEQLLTRFFYSSHETGLLVYNSARAELMRRLCEAGGGVFSDDGENEAPWDYVRQATRTESPLNEELLRRLTNFDTIRLLHAAIGKATEAGELLDALKKHIFYGKPLDMVNIQEEVGDGFWYDAIICDVSGVTFQQIQERNIAKLRARYPQKFEAEQAINRDLDAERKVLEEKPVQYGQPPGLGGAAHPFGS